MLIKNDLVFIKGIFEVRGDVDEFLQKLMEFLDDNGVDFYEIEWEPPDPE